MLFFSAAERNLRCFDFGKKSKCAQPPPPPTLFKYSAYDKLIWQHFFTQKVIDQACQTQNIVRAAL